MILDKAPPKKAKPFATKGQIFFLFLFLIVIAAVVGPNMLPFFGRDFFHEEKVQFVSDQVEQKDELKFLVVKGVLNSPQSGGVGEIFICQNTFRGNCKDISSKDIYPFIRGDIQRLADDEVVILIEVDKEQNGRAEKTAEFVVKVPLEGSVTKVFFGAGMYTPRELWNNDDGSWPAE